MTRPTDPPCADYRQPLTDFERRAGVIDPAALDAVDESVVDLLLDTGMRVDALASRLEAVSFGIDGYPPAALREVANSMYGAAYRAAMSLPGNRAAAAMNRLDRARPR